MKLSIGLLILAVMAIPAVAQQQDGKIVASIAGSQSVKNAPYSADAVSDSVQTLADGNRIVRSSTSKIYRNGEGRVRRELAKGTPALGGFYNFEPGVTIMDPLGSKVLLDSTLRTATRLSVLTPQRIEMTPLTDDQKKALEKLRVGLKIVDGAKITDEQRTAIKKLKEELRITTPLVVTPEGFRVAVSPALAAKVHADAVTSVLGPATLGGGTFVYSPSGQDKYDSKTEELGSRNFEGVDAEGTRTITTIPAGAIGNERPIEIVYERWYSKELQVVVMSKHSDPRFGEQTYRLTNVVRAEPDPSLFSVPTGYRVLGDDGGQIYRTRVDRTTAEREVVRTAAAVKAKPQQ